MIQVRQQIFETNSSSVHSITLCSVDTFQEWEKGNLIFDRDEEKLITLEEAEKRKKELRKHRPWYLLDDEQALEREISERFLTYNCFFDYQGDDNYLDYMEKYEAHEKINGVDIVAFGYYGHD